MLAKFRKHRKPLSILFLISMVSNLFPQTVMALTSGPSQPETQQFAPAGMDNMVDPFTGDFSYNIPLMDVGGYPLNLNYASGITQDQEASWVGLGWNLNVGAINRNLRGLPDDFAGDEVSREFDIKPNQTYGVNGNINMEVYGFKMSQFNIGFSSNLFYNNYNGFGVSMGVSPSISAGNGTKSGYLANLGLATTLGSETGLEVTPKLGIQNRQVEGNRESGLEASLSLPYSTKEGLKGLSLAAAYSSTTKHEILGKQNMSRGNSSFKGFAVPTYSPAMDHDTYNVNASLNFGFFTTDPGTELAGYGFGGYYSGQFIKDNKKSVPAYGYMYSGLSQSDDKMMDFNREKDGGYNQFTTNLPVTNFTYDVFQVSGQGVGGTYRLHRGDIGAVHDPKATDHSYSPSVGVEIGFGAPPSSKVGVDLAFNYTQSTSGKWPSPGVDIKHFVNNDKEELNKPSFEAAYFKKIGDLTVENDIEFFEDVQKKYSTVKHHLDKSPRVLYGDADLSGFYSLSSKKSGTTLEQSANSPIVDNNMRTQRRPRNTAFTPLTAEEATVANVLPIQNYEYKNFEWQNKGVNHNSFTAPNTGYTKSVIERVSDVRKPHHFSEIRVTDESGSRYVYGIPAYNTHQEEVTFAKEGGGDNFKSGLISYSSGSDDVAGHDNGFDNYFNKIVTPAYAYSYLLTCVLSSDYVDSDEIPGPSDGDLGNYTKFNYTKLKDEFKWRTPMAPGKASYTQGMIGTDKDDKANYVYGEKEIWYLHSIETRTHVAEFHISDRMDALGVTGTNGSIDNSKKLQKLDKIVLYSKADKLNSKAEPVKTVHFKYNYSLCKNTPNSIADEKGKLTLEKVWFTYGNSQKGVLNPYIFSYASGESNPDYGLNAYDRWGNYKQENISGLPNAQFPYSIQDKEQADKFAAVYSLNKIQTPTGATLKVHYESDDYAYVQNKQAMRMFKIVGVGKEGDDALYESGLKDSLGLIIDLKEGFKTTALTKEERNKEFRERYLKGIELMYYKVMLKVLHAGHGGEFNRYEYVPGYAEIDIQKSELLDDQVGGAYTRAKIELKAVEQKMGVDVAETNMMNPIVRNGWMYARLNLNRELRGLKDHGDGLKQILGVLISNADGIIDFFTSFGGRMKREKHSKWLKLDQSFVRLNEPDKIKLGGGHRVKALVMEDNWNSMKSDKEGASSTKETAYYGQVYDYTYKENGQIISAGVAAYEPALGGEENPFRRPVYVREKVPLAPSKEYYLEEPFGESFFPAPVVGYRKVVTTPVKIVDKDYTINNLQSAGTGRVEQEFYTAYDFPTIARNTELQTFQHKPGIIFKFMKFDCKDLVTCSQGYYVELNDMHGKQKATRVYPELDKSSLADNKPISEVEYRYKLNSDGSLNNNVTYINSDMSVVTKGPELGVDVDMVQDERHFESTTTGGGLQFNLKYFLVGIWPIFVPTFYPDFNFEQTRFRSVVTTKVVNKCGILESVTAKDNGASITTSNLAWDLKTGEVLLTSTENAFNDPVYNFTFPGHWAYMKMDPASENEAMYFTPSQVNTVEGLKDGDEVYLGAENSENSKKGYIYSDRGTKKIIDKYGAEITGSYLKAKVVRSGSRNMSNLPVGTITCLDNPIKSGNIKLMFSRIINSSAIEYKDNWQKQCECNEYGQGDGEGDGEGDGDGDGTIILLRTTGEMPENPFVEGLLGNMRPWRSWVYHSNRKQLITNDNINARESGYFEHFYPFWTVMPWSPNGISPSPVKGPWRVTSEITKYNPTGMEIENKDGLGRYSMAQFGYGHVLPVAVSGNSKYNESGFDGFEDYSFTEECKYDHFSWKKNYKDNISIEESHTGKQSIKVTPQTEVKMTKTLKVCEPEVVEIK